MLNNILILISKLADIGYKKVLFLFFLFILGGSFYIGLFYAYVSIKRNEEITLKTYETVKKIDPSNIFEEIYNISDINFELDIKKTIIKTRIETNADHIILYGVHNGQLVGTTYHLKRMTIITEDHIDSRISAAIDLNTINLSVFAETIDDILTKKFISIPRDSINEHTMKAYMKNKDFYYIMGSVILDIKKRPIALIFSFFDKYNSEKMMNDSTFKSKNEQLIIDATDYIYFKFASFLKQ